MAEASGVAASRRNAGIFWSHNDSGDAVIFALTAQGAVHGRVRVTGAAVDDWEAIAVGPCDAGSCVYVADIGDNDGDRQHVTIYRTAEPLPSDAATATVQAFHVSYPDAPHDAESLVVTADGELFIVTKGAPGAVALFHVPTPLGSGETIQLQRVGAPRSVGDLDGRDRPTGAAMSPNGRCVAVRTTEHVAFYTAADLLAGRWRDSVPDKSTRSRGTAG